VQQRVRAVRRASRTCGTLVAASAGLALAGCFPARYVPPTAQEPHAVLKFRRVYHTRAGTALRESVELGEANAYADAVSSELATAVRMDALLIHPQPAQLRFAVGFTHDETRLVTENYYEQVPYSGTESYSCGSYPYMRTCTRSTTQYRSEMRTRTVYRTYTISDGSCAGPMNLLPAAGHVYMAEVTYSAPSVCSLSCYEQLPLPGGEFQNTPCPLFRPVE
jgi:hypothetical protein